ncbi:MAG: hypothetical protein K6L73_07365 [Cellvibrionaceae bacterium]
MATPPKAMIVLRSFRTFPISVLIVSGLLSACSDKLVCHNQQGATSAALMAYSDKYRSAERAPHFFGQNHNSFKDINDSRARSEAKQQLLASIVGAHIAPTPGCGGI